MSEVKQEEKKMTLRMFLTEVMNELGETRPDLADYAYQEVMKQDERNAKMRAKKLEKQKPLMDAALDVLTEEFQTTAAIAEQMELTTSKISYTLRQLVEHGLAEDSLVKNDKNRPVKAYKLV